MRERRRGVGENKVVETSKLVLFRLRWILKGKRYWQVRETEVISLARAKGGDGESRYSPSLK